MFIGERVKSLRIGEHLVYRCDPATGIIQNEDGLPSRDGNPKCWIFDSLDKAKLFHSDMVSRNQDVEWVILDHNGAVIELFRPPLSDDKELEEKRSIFSKIKRWLFE